VAGREGADLDAAVAANGAREASEAARYLAYYGIDLADRSMYDLVVDSTAIPPEAVVSAILRRAGASG
jgi:cytidylate kinase